MMVAPKLVLVEPDARSLAVTLSDVDGQLRDALAASDAARTLVRNLRKTREGLVAQIVEAGERRRQTAMQFEAELDPQGRARCAGCRKRVSINHDRHRCSAERAWTEAEKPDGGIAYYCRACAERLS